MPLEIWLSLAFLVVATVGSGAYAGVRGRRAYRAFRAVSGTMTASLDDVLERSAKAEEHAATASRSSERLDRALARLHESLAQLAVLRAALDEARDVFSFARLPTK
jgi:hypothetical protein